MQNIIFLCFFISISATNVFSDEKPCGDWEPYKDKCLKIFDGLANYRDAENYCQAEQNSHLISIHHEENQKFIENFLKTNQITDNVWIGLKNVNGIYQWSDGTESHYYNWDQGSVKNLSDHCVQIKTDETEFGKWSDALCTKKNLVICEKPQLLSRNFFQTTVMDLLYDLQSQVAELKAENRDLKSEVSSLTRTVTTLADNPVPIGFIYVQLPGEKEPADVWPDTDWEDISEAYAGLFFRVNGGDSAAFGIEQSDDSPRLIQLYTDSEPDGSSIQPKQILEVSPGEWSQPLVVHEGSDNYWYFKFFVSASEVRPRNKSVKIWKRISEK